MQVKDISTNRAPRVAVALLIAVNSGCEAQYDSYKHPAPCHYDIIFGDESSRLV